MKFDKTYKNHLITTYYRVPLVD